jgi:GNAT superfamily N-acetyltransferase
VLRHLGRYLPPDRGRAVLHWFSGSKSDARRAVELGCYFSINEAMLRQPKQQALVRALPLDRILTETDGPFVKRDGAAVRPYGVVATVQQLAKVFEQSEQLMAQTIVRNLATLLRGDSHGLGRTVFQKAYKVPRECTAEELAAFHKLVALGSKVSKATLAAGIRRAALLAFARDERSNLIGVAALKSPLNSYRNDVFAKAQSPLLPADFPLEIGYIYVRPEATGHRLSQQLMDELVRRAGDRGLFLTTETTNRAIKKFAAEVGFIQSGASYESGEGNDDLLLLIRRS